MKQSPGMDGWLVLDKPKGLTSRAALDRAQRWFPRDARLGHAGTLDPLATGVLVVGVDRALRLIEYVQRMKKTYRASILLGARSDTDDADGTISPTSDPNVPAEHAVRGCLQQEFTGSITQVPPAYSAARVQGRRAYDLVRRGQTVSLAPRRIEIYGINLLSYAYPRLELEIHCGKGTYIRSLARDLGERLGCGGLIEELRRTRVGSFSVQDAISLVTGDLEAQAAMIPIAAALTELPRLALDAAEATALAHGQRILCEKLGSGLMPNKEVAVFEDCGRFVAVAIWSDPNELIPVKVFKD